MSESATLTIVMSIIAISAAVMTTAVMPIFDPVTLSLSMLGSLPDTLGSVSGRNGHVGAEPRPQLEPGVGLETDQHRDALHDLREVPRRIVGREQREARAGAAREAVDVARELHAGQGVHAHGGELSGSHSGDLIFLEVC